jgi:hypothetical protein
MKYPIFLRVAARHHDPSWVYFHHWTSADRLRMDEWLVTNEHPLAYEAGNNENRFYRIIVEIREHENGREKVQGRDIRYRERFLET